LAGAFLAAAFFAGAAFLAGAFLVAIKTLLIEVEVHSDSVLD
jgi:hypothetical protein